MAEVFGQFALAPSDQPRSSDQRSNSASVIKEIPGNRPVQSAR